MTQEEIMFFELKGSGDFLRIDVIGIALPDVEDDWDQKWVKSKVSLKAGGFSGQFDCDLVTTDFKKFRDQLSELYEKMNGVALFDTLEEQIYLKIKGDGIGHFKADCKVMDSIGTGNALEFKLEFDQTFIPQMIIQLDDIMRTFPNSANQK
ncbi:WapI family immunity protein [Salinimicrobium gaetbulicola]|uniref:Uncharacterized protein n=1 Tax=Salinimicrobium gaetbulicola TaxID=999702 RepID=A0ABW3IFZ8_9FLAO